MSGAWTRLDIDVAIEREDVLGLLGYPAGREPPARIARMLEEILPEARALASARGAYRQMPVDRAAEVGLQPIEAEALVIGLCTAGPAIEQRVRTSSAAGQPTRALLFDAAGSAAAEEAADRIGARICEADGADRAAALQCRLSPGYGRWSLQSQPSLFALLPHAELGIELLPSMLMVPRKSISFAMWLGATVRPTTGLAGCPSCGLERCRYRHARAGRQAREAR